MPNIINRNKWISSCTQLTSRFSLYLRKMIRSGSGLLSVRLSSTTKSASIVLITVSLLYICYSLTAYSNRGVVQNNQDINNRRRDIAQQFYQTSRDSQDNWVSGYNSILPSTNKEICGVKSILNTLNEETSSINCSRVIYNRVPKCGSRTVLSTFKILSKTLNYNVIGMEKPSVTQNFYRKKERLVSFVENFTEFQSPFLFSQHVHYINFSRFHLPSPIFINVIRDPVERQISHYYYNMYGSSNKPLSQPRLKFNKSIDECMKAEKGPCYRINEVIPFFCGHEQKCRVRSSFSLQKAKRVATENVLVIGFTEDLPAFMEVLEFVLPCYFYNATTVFKSVSEDSQNRTKTAKKPDVLPGTIEKLREHLKLEYEFYYFAKQRFYNLLRRIRMIKSESNKTQYYKNKRDFFKWWKKTNS